jgi:NAD(P)-dependent dehydrogenase (short-subunit alcohol dehydrogenase family)
MSAKTVFITGSSTGIGRATAALFSARGWTVIATMRQPDKEAELGALPGVVLLPLDVTSPLQIQAAATSALERGPVDVVFNNAGYGLAGPIEGTDDGLIVREIETNLLGVIRTTKAFIPHFRERRSGVFLVTTSIGGLVTFPFNSVYHATKWALEGLYESLSFELSKFGIRVKTIAPGGVKTDFAGRSIVRTTHPAYQDLIDKATAVFMDPARRALHSTSEQIAEAVFAAATDPSDRVHYVAGQDAEAAFAQRRQVGDEAFRRAIDQRFFG